MSSKQQHQQPETCQPNSRLALSGRFHLRPGDSMTRVGALLLVAGLPRSLSIRFLRPLTDLLHSIAAAVDLLRLPGDIYLISFNTQKKLSNLSL